MSSAIDTPREGERERGGGGGLAHGSSPNLELGWAEAIHWLPNGPNLLSTKTTIICTPSYMFFGKKMYSKLSLPINNGSGIEIQSPGFCGQTIMGRERVWKTGNWKKIIQTTILAKPKIPYFITWIKLNNNKLHISSGPILFYWNLDYNIFFFYNKAYNFLKFIDDQTTSQEKHRTINKFKDNALRKFLQVGWKNVQLKKRMRLGGILPTLLLLWLSYHISSAYLCVYYM